MPENLPESLRELKGRFQEVLKNKIFKLFGGVFKQVIDECFVQKDIFFVQIMKSYKKEVNSKLIEINTSIKSHPSDITGKSTYEQTDIKFPNGYIRIACYDMQEHMETNDALIIDFFTNEVDKWLQNEFGQS